MTWSRRHHEPEDHRLTPGRAVVVIIFGIAIALLATQWLVGVPF